MKVLLYAGIIAAFLILGCGGSESEGSDDSISKTAPSVQVPASDSIAPSPAADLAELMEELAKSYNSLTLKIQAGNYAQISSSWEEVIASTKTIKEFTPPTDSARFTGYYQDLLTGVEGLQPLIATQDTNLGDRAAELNGICEVCHGEYRKITR